VSEQTPDWKELASRVIAGEAISRDDALAAVNVQDAQLLELLSAAFMIRSHHHGRLVRVHVLRNAKSGLCPEDCGFCSQSLRNDGEAEQYPMQSVKQLVAGADEAVQMGAVTYCMVTSTRGPSSSEVQTVTEAARQIKERHPKLRLCASLGMLKDGQAERLVDAGIDRYNHNIETSPRFFENIVTTHAFADRVATVQAAKQAGMEACCGGILGMGESRADWVDLAFALRELSVESVPLNFLDPRPGTPLSKQSRLTPRDALRALGMFRFVHPRADIRVAGGREVTLRSLQPLALYPANSIFTSGYLTTGGNEPSADWKMITEAGFEPEVIAA
jgi:biotin synthase